jgi:serine/threonine protein phosphatase PrpC
MRLRRTVHRGSVLASGLAIDTSLVPESSARERILALSFLGIDVFRAGAFLVLTFRAPFRLDCAATIGSPLVRYGRLFSSSPLEPDEQKVLETIGNTVVLVVGGFPKTVFLDDAARENISRWIDVSDFLVIEDVHSLGEVVSEPQPVHIEVASDVRQSLGVTRPTEDAKRLVQSLVQRGAAGDSGRGRASVISAVGGLLSALWRLVKAGGRQASQRKAATKSELVVVPNAEQKGESWLSKIRNALQHLAARALLWSRLAPLVGRRHAEYLARMLEMFDSNQLDDALRHAIPLTSEVEAALRPPPLRVPSPRTDLAIVPARATASTSLGLGGDLFEGLRQRYRRAFERLVALGEIEKAAFVLAELLNSNEEAVAFLERNNRLRLAAEVAEARSLPPGLVIRQWFLAGDRARAIRIARQTGAFGDAVVRLESSHKDEGRALRLLWGDALASGGAYSAAVDAVWPLADARNLALNWLDRAIEIGGPTGARMLARKVRLLPASFSELRDRALALLRNDGEDRGSVAQALGYELAEGTMTDETRVLARATARRLLRDAENKDVDRLVHRLLDVCGDAALRADVRAAGSSERGRSLARIRVSAFACTHVGEKRSVNEDACVAAFLHARATPPKIMSIEGDAGEKGIVLGVFDGTGGWEAEGAADIASRMAAETVTSWLRTEFSTCAVEPGQWARCLAVSLEQANRQMLEDAAATPSHRGIGSTATVATLCRENLFVAQVGDTRGYLLRGDSLVQVTRDHSLLNDYVERMVADGTPMTQAQIDEFPHKNVITRCLGTAEQVNVDLTRVELQDGDVILLCSDGLWSVVKEDSIRRALVERPTPQVACDALLSMALEAGAPDNIAIVVARVEGKGLPPHQPGPVVHKPFVPPTLDGGEIQNATPLRSRTTPLQVRRLAADRGTMPVLDAAELPDGRMLVALGEVGVWLLSREGRVLTRFSEPASRIVLSDHGDRAILLAQRGEVFRVGRLELVAKRVRPWCDARFDQFAPDFDGSTWFVARGDTVYAIEATADRWEHHWKVDERAAAVGAIRRDSKTVSVWFVKAGTNGETWTFEVPSLTLRHRQPIEKADARFLVGTISAGGKFAGWQAEVDKDPVAQAFMHGTWKELAVSTTSLPEVPYFANEWVAVPVVDQEGTTIHLMDSTSFQERARIELEGAIRNVGVRLQGDHLLVFDGCGRVVVLSLRSGAVLRDYRVS